MNVVIINVSAQLALVVSEKFKKEVESFGLIGFIFGENIFCFKIFRMLLMNYVEKANQDKWLLAIIVHFGIICGVLNYNKH